MNCEEFDLAGAGFAPVDEAARRAAQEHVNRCPHCAALQESWQAARVELDELASETYGAEAPARVEMRLRQEFRNKHRMGPARRAAAIAAWTLATAAVLLGLVSVWSWEKAKHDEAAKVQPPPSQITVSPSNGATTPAIAPSDGLASSGNAVVSEVSGKRASKPRIAPDNDAGKFTMLPGSVPSELDEAAVVSVRMQRGALGALGLPVNEERAGEWIQVELLVGNDGLPQAVKLQR